MTKIRKHNERAGATPHERAGTSKQARGASGQGASEQGASEQAQGATRASARAAQAHTGEQASTVRLFGIHLQPSCGKKLGDHTGRDH